MYIYSIQGTMREGGGKILRIFSCIYIGAKICTKYVGMIQLVRHRLTQQQRVVNENSSQFFH